MISGSRSRLVAIAVSAVATASPVVMICGAAAAAHKVGVARLQAERTATIVSFAQPNEALGVSGASSRNHSHFAPGNGPPPTAQSTTTGTAPGPAPTSAPSTTAAPPPAPTITAPAQLVINTPYDFAVGLLYALGDPLTSQNTGAVVSWEKAEGGNWNSPAKYNPLNTTKRMPGSYSINGAGVQSYSSWPQGLAATVQTLEGGAYRGILSALKTGTSEQAVERAVASSIWGTGSFQLLP